MESLHLETTSSVPVDENILKETSEDEFENPQKSNIEWINKYFVRVRLTVRRLEREVAKYRNESQSQKAYIEKLEVRNKALENQNIKIKKKLKAHNSSSKKQDDISQKRPSTKNYIKSRRSRIFLAGR